MRDFGPAPTSRISLYFKNSASRFYGAVTALAMLLLYEVFIILQSPSDIVVRNAPEAWFRDILGMIGISRHWISLLMIFISLLAVIVFYDSKLLARDNKKIFLIMIAESVFWGLITGVVIQKFMSRLLFMSGGETNSIIQNLGLSIGAGLFEELLFRVILTTALIWAAGKLIPNKWLSALCAIILASLLFSMAHYTGNMADQLELYSFLFRFLGGLWFTTLYFARGFAIVSMSHAFYDIFTLAL